MTNDIQFEKFLVKHAPVLYERKRTDCNVIQFIVQRGTFSSQLIV